MSATRLQLRFVVALEAEARPLIEHYRLQLDRKSLAFKIYRPSASITKAAQGPSPQETPEVALVVSGIGKAAAAAATAYLHLAAGGAPDAVWLNVGIAGHGTRPLGEPLLAHKIQDRAAGRSWYPPLVLKSPCATDQVITVDRPERKMKMPGAFEMEASGFVATAGRFASAELVQCLKVVSDGPTTDLQDLTPRRVQDLIRKNLPVVTTVAEACGELALELRNLDAAPPDLQTCLERWHFTVTEQRELRRLLVRRRTLAPELTLPLANVRSTARGREVNRRLRSWLDDLPMSLG